MAQYNRNNWHHIPGIGGTMATGLSTLKKTCFEYYEFIRKFDFIFKHNATKDIF